MTETARIYLLTQILALITLLAILMLGLLPAFLAGFLVYHLVDFGSRVMARFGIMPLIGKLVLLLLLAVLIISAVTFSMSAAASHLTDGPESVVILLQRMADIVDRGKTYLPTWTYVYLPANMEEWQETTARWLRDNARDFSIFGAEIGGLLLHTIMGMVIGGMIAINPGFQEINGPLAKAMQERINLISSAFKRVVFSQIRISALNTVLTGLFLAVVMPLIGMTLPLTKTMIVVTFFVGLIPIIGNLISNTVIFLIALSVSPVASVIALAYLIIIHKLEYFVNARIIGSQIRARAWEVLLAMIVMEAGFGIPGLIAAPIYYSYLKDELTERKLI